MVRVSDDVLLVGAAELDALFCFSSVRQVSVRFCFVLFDGVVWLG